MQAEKLPRGEIFVAALTLYSRLSRLRLFSNVCGWLIQTST